MVDFETSMLWYRGGGGGGGDGGGSGDLSRSEQSFICRTYIVCDEVVVCVVGAALCACAVEVDIGRPDELSSVMNHRA